MKRFALVRKPENARYDFPALEIIAEFETAEKAIALMTESWLGEFALGRMGIIENIPIKISLAVPSDKERKQQ